MFVRNLLVLVMLTLVACSGGGGGGDSESSAEEDSLGGSSGVRILHAVIDTEPVRLNIAGQGEIARAEFAEIKRYFPFEGGEQDLSLIHI